MAREGSSAVRPEQVDCKAPYSRVYLYMIYSIPRREQIPCYMKFPWRALPSSLSTELTPPRILEPSCALPSFLPSCRSSFFPRRSLPLSLGFFSLVSVRGLTPVLVFLFQSSSAGPCLHFAPKPSAGIIITDQCFVIIRAPRRRWIIIFRARSCFSFCEWFAFICSVVSRFL